MTLPVGSRAPSFALRNQRREQVTLEELKGQTAVLVFIPFAFTRVCEGELCEIRDNADLFETADARIVAITCNAGPVNAKWAEENEFDFDILSDFWPHGEVSRSYDTFNEQLGYAERTTYILNQEGLITDVIRSEELRTARPFQQYVEALAEGD